MKDSFNLCKGYKEKNMEKKTKNNQKLEDVLQQTTD